MKIEVATAAAAAAAHNGHYERALFRKRHGMHNDIAQKHRLRMSRMKETTSQKKTISHSTDLFLLLLLMMMSGLKMISLRWMMCLLLVLMLRDLWLVVCR